MSTSQPIVTSYDLQPPVGCEVANSEPKSTFKIPVGSSKPAQQDGAQLKSYYAFLHTAIEAARNQIGEDLTKWRDAVGKAELNKEPKRGKEDDEEDAGEEEES
ncbi:hypothetical protein Moror_8341 [Moniliophthora roreri MCA 2997]|uniref:EKC/KEOPS complex subunit GON7 n=2 Tax=Moniliophthora roreri TaxID=221103 RepID=V2XMU5_MONRO|nr:hypothetical protein Moror_8341 [Moniliophthora roreri MCA 2997]